MMCVLVDIRIEHDSEDGFLVVVEVGGVERMRARATTIDRASRVVYRWFTDHGHEITAQRDDEWQGFSISGETMCGLADSCPRTGQVYGDEL